MASSPVVGRDDERAALDDALRRCRSGRGGVVLVSGEAGVGKSRLVAEALSGWDGGHLSATAVRGSGAYAALAAAVRGSGAPGRDGQGSSWVPDPARAIPETLCAIARTRPTVLVLEDLHLADSATIQVLPAVAEAMAHEPLLVVGVYRSDGLARGHAVRGLRAELRRAGRLVDIALRPLTEQQTGELLAVLLRATPSPALVAAVHERTDGLPFFVEELTAGLLRAGLLAGGSPATELPEGARLPLPESVTDAVLSRTADLRREHEAAVEWAVTLGTHVDLPTLAVLAGPEEVDCLIEAGLLLEYDVGVAAFRHALVRDALHRSIPWARRRRLHQSVAEHLERSGAPPAVLAEHWVAAHDPGRARPLLLASAEQHCAAHAYRDAAVLFRRALALWPEGDDPAARTAALERLAACTEWSGDPGAAVRTWSDLARRYGEIGDAARAGDAHRRAANAAELSGDRVGTAAGRLAAAEAFLQAGALSEAAAQRLALGAQLRAAGRLSESLEHAVAATELAMGAERRDVQAHAMALEGAVRAALGERRGVELARAGLELALALGMTGTAAEAQYALAEALEYTADYASAVHAYESAFELCRDQDLGDFASICYVCISPAARLMGEWDRTLAVCAEVLADPGTAVLARRVAEEESGLITVLRGDHRRARGPLRRAAEFGQGHGIFGLEVGARWGLALVCELDEDDAGVRSAAAGLLERCRATEECHYALPALRWVASFLGDRDDVDGLSACHRVLAALATRSGSAKVLSALAHAGAELALAEGDAVQAGGQFARSVDLLAGITAPFERAQTQVRWGRCAAAGGDRDAAIALISSAYRCARKLGARPLAGRCATALAELGEPVDLRLGRLAARAGQPTTLTGRERDVLLRLAEGRTNREIAAELFLSTRTVDMHVRNVLTKLDCSSRTAAVRRAAERGLLPAAR